MFLKLPFYSNGLLCFMDSSGISLFFLAPINMHIRYPFFTSGLGVLHSVGLLPSSFLDVAVHCCYCLCDLFWAKQTEVYSVDKPAPFIGHAAHCQSRSWSCTPLLLPRGSVLTMQRLISIAPPLRNTQLRTLMNKWACVKDHNTSYYNYYKTTMDQTYY